DVHQVVETILPRLDDGRNLARARERQPTLQNKTGGSMTKRFVVFLVVATITSLAMAQSIPTATIIGRVTADGAVLPGVTVTVASPNLQGTRSTVTTQTGEYLVPLLPPGSYTVKFELSGMAAMTRKVILTARSEE